MTSNFDQTMLNTSFQSVNASEKDVIQHTVTEDLRIVAGNTSLVEDCLYVNFSGMEFLPWDNPDNIASAEVEDTVCALRNNVLWLLFLIGGPANIINMAVFYKQGLQDRVNLCLFALALADGLYLSVALLFHGEQLYIQFTTKERFGPVATFLTNLHLVSLLGFCFVSPVLSAIIAIERCLCVFNPLKFQSLLRTRTMTVIIIAVYIVVLGVWFITVFRYRVGCIYDLASGVTVRTSMGGEFYKLHKELIDHLDSFLFGVGLPVVEMVVVLTMTIMTIVKLRQAVTWRSGTSSSISPREMALTKMLVGNSILFMACVFPIGVIRFSRVLLPEMNAGRRHHNLFLSGIWITEIFHYINATFNFFVYYIMGSRYRETFWALFGKKRKPEKR